MFSIQQTSTGWEVTHDGTVVLSCGTYDEALGFIGGALTYANATGALAAMGGGGDAGSDGLLPEAWMSDQGICFSEPTGDGRDFSQCTWTWRDPNESLVPVMLQTETEMGHFGAQLAGFMGELHMVGTTPQASGRWYDTETGRAARDLLLDGRRFGVSVDATNADVEFVCTEEDEDGYCIDGLANFLAYEIGGLCYSDDTEILTEERGWQRFADLLPGERVATRNQKSAEFEWQEPLAYTNDQWDKPMIRFYNKSMDLLVTPNHRMLVTDVAGQEKFIRADELATARPGKYMIPATSVWHDDDVETFWIDGAPEVAEGLCACGCGEPTVEQRSGSAACSLDGCDRVSVGRGWCNPHYQRWIRHGNPRGGGRIQERSSLARRMQVTLPGHGHGRETADLAINGDHFAAFLGAWLAEGCLNKTEVVISQMPTSRGFGPYKALLAEMAPTAWHDGRSFRFKNVRLAAYLRQFGHAPDKFVPQELKNFSRRQLRLFWDAYVLGDGSADGRRLYTTSKRMAGDLQEVAQKIGLWANVKDDSDRRDKYRTFIDGREILPENKHDCYLINYRPQTKGIWRWHTEEVPYSGMVRCVTVPNETLYVRREGKVLWCGNTMTPFPAFARASIIQAPTTVIADAGPSIELVVDGGGPVGTVTSRDVARLVAAARVDDDSPAAIAATVGVDLDAPPRAWFESPEPQIGQDYEPLGSLGDEWLVEQGGGHLAMPLHIGEDGRVLGHIAYWGQCHVGYPGTCVTPPESASGYAHFHVGETVCADGTRIPTGQFSAGCDHALAQMRAPEARDHYAHNGMGWANVRIINGVFGPFACGALRSDVTRSQVTVLRAGAMSGDWRRLGGHLELIASLAVTAPGFPIAREAITASGLLIPSAPALSTYSSGGVQESLVASAIVRRCPDCQRRATAEAAARSRGIPRQQAPAPQMGTAEMMRLLSVLERRTRHLVPDAAAYEAARITR